MRSTSAGAAQPPSKARTGQELRGPVSPPRQTRTPGLRARSDGVFILSQAEFASMRKELVMLGTFLGYLRRRTSRSQRWELQPRRTTARLAVEVLDSRALPSFLTPVSSNGGGRFMT